MNLLGSLANQSDHYNRNDPDEQLLKTYGTLANIINDIGSKKRMRAFGDEFLEQLQDPSQEMSGPEVVGLIQKHGLQPQEAEYAIKLMTQSKALDAAINQRNLGKTKVGDVYDPTTRLPKSTASIDQAGALPKELFAPTKATESKQYVLGENQELRGHAGELLAKGPSKTEKIEPTKTREVKFGDKIITQEWNGREWKNIASSPMWKPESEHKETAKIDSEMKSIAGVLKEATGDNIFLSNPADLNKEEKNTLLDKIQNYSKSAKSSVVRDAATRFMTLGEQRGWWKLEKPTGNIPSPEDWINQKLKAAPTPNAGPKYRGKISPLEALEEELTNKSMQSVLR